LSPVISTIPIFFTHISFIKWLFLYLELSGWLGKKSDLASIEKSRQQGKKSDLARNEIRLASKELGPD